MLHDVRAIDGLPFEISGDLRVQEHLDKQAIRHDKFGDQIDVPVSIVSILRGWVLAGTELLPEVGKVQ